MNASFFGLPIYSVSDKVRFRNARIISLTGIVTASLMAAMYLYEALQTGRWQYRVLVICAAILFIACLTGLILVLRKRERAAIWLEIMALNLTFLAAIFFVSGLGLQLGIGLVLVVIFIALQALTAREALRALVTGLIFGGAAVAIDATASALMPFVERLSAPLWLQTAFIILIGIIVMILGTTLFHEYPFRTVRTRLVALFLLITLVPSWILILSLFTTSWEALAETTGAIGWLIALLITVVSVVIANAAAGLLAEPVTQLASVAARVGSGDYYSLAQMERSDELGTVAHTLDQITAKIRDLIFELEQRILERGQLQRTTERSIYQSEQLQAVAEVARATATMQSPERLLPDIALRISENFGFYHVGIFLLDESGKYAILRAANSEGGGKMIARGHKLEVGQVGIVGYVTSTGKPRIARDVGEDAVYFQNPDLPQTRSEMALPLKIGDHITGALDIQSQKPDAFTREDVEVLSTVADQVSIAIENSRLFESTRRSLGDVETLYRQYLQREWSRLPREEKLAGFRYALTGATPLEKPIHEPEVEQVVSKGEIYQKMPDQEGEPARLAVPIQLRGEMIGYLNVTTAGRQPWTEDQVDLVKAVADRLALALENARLLETTQRRAETERAIGEIASKISGSVNLRNVLRTTVQELGRALPGSDVIIQFLSDIGKDSK